MPSLNELISKNKQRRASRKKEDMAYIPTINTHGKPYGAAPGGLQSTSSGQLGQGLFNTGILGGGVGLGSTVATTSSMGTLTINTSTMVTFSNVMPFTKDKIDKLKTIEPRKIVKQLAPDYTDPLIAWRSWGVGYDDNGDLILNSIGCSKYSWMPKRMIKAECINFGHKAPQKGCTCGTWSFKELDTLMGAIVGYGRSIQVVGQVYNWGKVVETDNGYRSEFSYPKELWILNEEHEELGYNYNVPIRLLNLSEISDKIAK